MRIFSMLNTTCKADKRISSPGREKAPHLVHNNFNYAPLFLATINMRFLVDHLDRVSWVVDGSHSLRALTYNSHP